MKNTFYSPKNIAQFDYVVEKLRLDLKELASDQVPEEEVLEYLDNLLKQFQWIESRKSMMFGFTSETVCKLDVSTKESFVLQIESPERYPNEPYYDYVVTPTQIALSIIVYSYLKHESVRNIYNIKQIISDLMDASASTGFAGTSLYAIEGILSAMDIFTMGRMHEFVKMYPDLNENFTNLFQAKLNFVLTDVANGKPVDAFCGTYEREAEKIFLRVDM